MSKVFSVIRDSQLKQHNYSHQLRNLHCVSAGYVAVRLDHSNTLRKHCSAMVGVSFFFFDTPEGNLAKESSFTYKVCMLSVVFYPYSVSSKQA